MSPDSPRSLLRATRLPCCSLQIRYDAASGPLHLLPLQAGDFSILFNAVLLAPGVCLAHTSQALNKCLLDELLNS